MNQTDTTRLLVNQPKTKRGRETMEKICAAAEELFCEKGYYGASISDITNRAGVGAGTFYIYFESKLTLYEYLLTDYSHQIRKYLSIAVADCKTRREMEREGLRAWLEFIVDHKYVFNITWEAMFIEKRLFDDYYATFSRAYAEHLIKAQDSGEVRQIDPEVMSFALMGITNFVGLHWVIFKEEKNFDHVVDETMKFLDGMFTERV